eukprot:TRINITY_DN11791_c0_g1_i1.p1 TRINITY_DN11791_c0_g1~~TRINITY_DN11791_c0_g1_i1.p1  ORF type:complete len:794 (-),score=154.35 TRINITY_DN11791_c0_g1_i1:87-2468(-)
MLTALPKETVRRICAGQVIVDLTSCVKELLENSLDAGAESIEIRLEKGGMQSISVRDNGTGIADLQNCGKRYYTSKIADYDSIGKLETLGFRGEGLNSLCVIADVTISTQTRSDLVGSKVDLDATGAVILASPQASPIGTCVTVKNIFKRLPVRHKVMQAAVKTEGVKIQDLITKYALVHNNVRFNLVNAPRAPLRKLATPDLQTSIGALFGRQLVSALVRVHSTEEDLVVEGFVTSTTNCDAAVRSKGDHLFVYINKRPVSLPVVTKIIVSRWRLNYATSGKKFPFACICLSLPPDSYDVNVTPSKDTVFLHNEALIVECVHEALDAVYAKRSSDDSDVDMADTADDGVAVAPIALSIDLTSAEPEVSLLRPAAAPATVSAAVVPVVEASPAAKQASDTASVVTAHSTLSNSSAASPQHVVHAERLPVVPTTPSTPLTPLTNATDAPAASAKSKRSASALDPDVGQQSIKRFATSAAAASFASPIATTASPLITGSLVGSASTTSLVAEPAQPLTLTGGRSARGTSALPIVVADKSFRSAVINLEADVVMPMDIKRIRQRVRESRPFRNMLAFWIEDPHAKLTEPPLVPARFSHEEMLSARFVGCVPSTDVSMMMCGEQLCFFAYQRAQECLSLRNMINTYELARQPLKRPLVVDERLLPERGDALLRQGCEGGPRAALFAFNGFELSEETADGAVCVTHLTDLIPNYGLKDLYELVAIVLEGESLYSIPRPSAVMRFFESEAARVCRSVALSNEQAGAIFDNFKHLEPAVSSCAHGKLIVTGVAVVPDVSL